MIGFAKDGLVKSFRADRLVVRVYATREQMGKAAAAAVADEVLRLIASYGRAIGIFASAPSQNEFLAALVESSDIDWTRVVGFHLDEYLGMNDHAILKTIEGPIEPACPASILRRHPEAHLFLDRHSAALLSQ